MAGPNGIKVFVTITQGPDREERWKFEHPGTYRIGRGKDCAIHLKDQAVSRVHCLLIVSSEDVVLSDAGSRWGTRIDSRPVKRTKLSPGTIVELGDSQFRVDFELPQQETLPPRHTEEDVAVQPRAAHIEQTIPPPARRPAVADGPSVVMKPDDPPIPATAEMIAGLDLNQLVGQRFVYYKVEKHVARAASGIVYRALDTRTNLTVALKLYWPALFTDRVVTARFLRSMRTMLPLEHENLIRVQVAGRSQGLCFTASEYVEGESAAQLISRVGIAGMLDWRTVWKIAYGLTKALEYIHGKNVLHRNLRPNNILIRKSDQCVKLGDTMLAKSLAQLGQEALTQRGEVVGDLYYLSPEQVSGGLAIDQRTDLYSLGSALYALLTGKPPFLGGPGEVVSKILNEPPVPPTKTHLTIPASFEGIVLRLLAKHPDGRYATASLVLKDLERTGRHNNLM